ncbi:MAG TPA: redoxin domain-containing protein [Gammaproteobacteria bacterium]|nr:redoxin domain-containing protein [Gammaproteobacteria bacterium]HIL98108.1 redoxin domain-containing protein [Pseudomonadales bacterium]
MNRPVLRDEAGEAWILGESADDRTVQLQSLDAPDFTLPDVNGNLHSLSDYRGKKVYLCSWASW